jgi:hypothetical protein
MQLARRQRSFELPRPPARGAGVVRFWFVVCHGHWPSRAVVGNYNTAREKRVRMFVPNRFVKKVKSILENESDATDAQFDSLRLGDGQTLLYDSELDSLVVSQ